MFVCARNSPVFADSESGLPGITRSGIFSTPSVPAMTFFRGFTKGDVEAVQHSHMIPRLESYDQQGHWA